MFTPQRNQASMSPTAFSLTHVSKIYDNGVVALQNMNLTVTQGEFITLVGPSGCGKSTALKLIARLQEPTDGQITGQDGLNSELAFVFQEAALMPWATVLENVELPLKLARLSPRQARIKSSEALQMVGLQGFESVYPRQLSGGMKMRVSIARALVTQPQLMLMDEPFGALDEMTRSKLNSDVLKLWHQKNWTVIFVTHNIYEAVYLSNRVIFMAPAPGRVMGEINIDAPYPRTEEFRTSRLYNEYCREILGYFQDLEMEIA